MLVHFGTDLLKAEWSSAVVCVGTFDGVHLGHQKVISTAVSKARECERPCVLVTFDRHPAAILAPERKPLSVATTGQNLAVFEKLGVPICVVLAFDEKFAQVTATDFLDQTLVNCLKAAEVVVGHDFAMGRGREGTTEWLSSHIATTVVPPFQLDGKRVSSSEVRETVANGQVERAGELLGRPFAISGVVVAGQKLGRQLGYPTLNIARSDDQVTPGDGIYAGMCRTGQGEFKAAVSVGLRPAIESDERTIEAYLLDFPGDEIYGQSVELLFHTRLRDQMPFEDLDALKNQIKADVERVATMPSMETTQ